MNESVRNINQPEKPRPTGVNSRATCALVIAWSLIATTTADALDLATVPMALPVADNVYVMHGHGGLPSPDNRAMIANLGFVLTTDGVVVIDSGGSDSHAGLLMDAIESVTDAPIVAVFNTHAHGDHWLGNGAIKARYPDAKLYAHELQIEAMTPSEGERWINLFDQLSDGSVAGTEAVAAEHVVGSGETVEIGQVQFTILHTGAAHTDADIMIQVEPMSVVFLGDNAFYQQIGRMDDGDFAGNIEALDRAMALGASVYVPGHGPTTQDASCAIAYRDYLATLRGETEKYYEEGLSDFEIKDKVLPLLSQWVDWLGFEDQIGRHLSLAYLEVEQASF